MSEPGFATDYHKDDDISDIQVKLGIYAKDHVG